MYSKAFLTGCDHNTEWMLDWFCHNYFRYNTAPIIFADFGVSEEVRKKVETVFNEVIYIEPHQTKAWFCKPEAMLKSSKIAEKVVWIDTDCEILKPLDKIFDYVVDNKLSMVQDIPWTTRRGEVWHNTGVVGFKGKPQILHDWIKAIELNPTVGDQEVLHLLLRKDPLTRRVHIEDLPEKYNWLRLNNIDNRSNNKKCIMHWTGNKGKEEIKKKVKEL